MNSFIELLSGPAWREILLTLAHSLWQGAVIASLLALVLRQIAGNRPQARYVSSLAALAGLVLSCLVTWSILDLPAAEATVGEAIADAPRTAAATVTVAGDPARPLANPGAPALPIVAAPTGSFWQSAAALCSALWIAGTSVMLLRMIWLLSGARRLARRPPLADPRVLEMVERLRGQLGILRRIVVVEATTVGPAVLGVLRPVLLLPPALAGDLSPVCLEAILAHELAHIRRHDYLVNLVQMLVEAALFFNPAVWWISRQIRREREACCDALAVRITGQPLSYAAALADWIEQQAPGQLSAPAIAWSSPRGSALDRIQRLVTAGYRPELRGSWSALAVGLALSVLTLGALWTGTRVGVALAAEILSPKQRMEQLAQERDELRPVVDPDGKATVSGTIRTEEGPAVTEFRGWFVVKHPGLSSTKGVSLSSPDFMQSLPCGDTWIIVSAAGYAPTIKGPLQTRLGDVLADLDVVLRPGFSAKIRLVDPSGEPVTDAAAMYSDLGVGIGDRWRADEHGVILLDNLADAVHQITIEAPGFQTLRMEPARFKPGEVLTRSLVPTVPTKGVVVSPDGKPIARAAIRCLAQSNPNQIHDVGGPVLATTDASGRFVLDTLDDGSQYALLVEAPDHSRRFFPSVGSGQTDLRWVVGPPITVIGHVEGDLSKLKRDGGQPAVRFWQSSSAQIDSVHHMSLRLRDGMAKVESVGGKHQFQITDLAPGELGILAAGQQQTLQPTGPTSEITIDLDRLQPSLALRHVVLRFVGADKGLSPSGQIWFSTNSTDSAQSDHWPWGHATIADGKIEFDAPAPGSAYYRMENVVGYWFDDGNLDVPASDEPLVHDVAVVPAGAIRGRLVNLDGTPAGDDADVGARSAEERRRQGEKLIAIDNIPVDAAGEFFVSPLPLGRTYVVRGSRGFENVMSQPLRVDAASPNPTVELRFSPTRDLRGRLLAANGQPLAGMPLDLDFSSSTVSTTYSPGVLTDREGRFELKGLSSGARQYQLTIKPTRDFQPLQVDLALDRPTIEIRLKAGHVIAGRVIDAATGSPLAGVELHADLKSDQAPKWPYRYEAEQPQTEADGRFRFSTLPQGSYGIQVQVNGISWATQFPPPEDHVFHTGDTAVELRVTPLPAR